MEEQRNSAVQVTRKSEKCEMCKMYLEMFEYKNVKGWQCNRCIPVWEACRSLGCKYKLNVKSKCNDHQIFFCPLATKCEICNTDVAKGFLYSHYTSVHENMIHKPDSIWQATTTGAEGRRCFLITAKLGTMLCWYYLNDTNLEIFLITTVLSNVVAEYVCEVRLINPVTGQERIFSPFPIWNQRYDWHIVVNKEEFSAWSTTFDVCVKII